MSYLSETKEDLKHFLRQVKKRSRTILPKIFKPWARPVTEKQLESLKKEGLPVDIWKSEPRTEAQLKEHQKKMEAELSAREFLEKKKDPQLYQLNKKFEKTTEEMRQRVAELDKAEELKKEIEKKLLEAERKKLLELHERQKREREKDKDRDWERER